MATLAYIYIIENFYFAILSQKDAWSIIYVNYNIITRWVALMIQLGKFVGGVGG